MDKFVSKSPVYLDKGTPKGKPIFQKHSYLKDLDGYFYDNTAYKAMNPNLLLYHVDVWMPVEEGTDGGLFFGLSTIEPGLVGKEFFMTKGHFHKKKNTAEFYWGITGRGVLLLMDMQGKARCEIVEAGSLHYIPGYTAHRLVNVGDCPLQVGACWPSDAGHEYSVITQSGFSLRIFSDKEKDFIVKENN